MRGTIVVEAQHFTVCEAASVIDTGMIGLINDRDGAPANKRRNHAQIRLVAGRENEGSFFLDELGDAALKLFVHMSAAVEQARAGHRGAIFEDSTRR